MSYTLFQRRRSNGQESPRLGSPVKWVFTGILASVVTLAGGGSASAQGYLYQVALDTDNSTLTGCSTPPSEESLSNAVTGIELLLNIMVDLTPPYTVLGVTSQACSGDTVDAPIARSASAWPIGIASGINGADVIEAQVPLKLVGSGETLRLYAFATSANGNRAALLTKDGTKDGPPILLSLLSSTDTVAIPTLGKSGILLLILLIGALALRFLRRTCPAGLSVLGFLLSAGLIWPVAWASFGQPDGDPSDWNVEALATDLVGRGEHDPMEANILALFGRQCGADLCLRLDVRFVNGDLEKLPSEAGMNDETGISSGPLSTMPGSVKSVVDTPLVVTGRTPNSGRKPGERSASLESTKLFSRPAWLLDCGEDVAECKRTCGPLNAKTPLILIHGIHANWTTWEAYLARLTLDPDLDRFRPFIFDWDEEESRLFIVQDYSEASIIRVGGRLRDELERCSSEAGWPSNQGIVIVAHSMGGLVARAMMQAHWFRGRQGGESVLRLITLATPHHGTPLTELVPFLPLEGLEWDNYEDPASPEPKNRVLRCLNSYRPFRIESPSLPADERSCPSVDEYNREGFYDKIIAYAGKLRDDSPNVNRLYNRGYVYLTIFSGYPSNDGLVPTESALFEGSTSGPVDSWLQEGARRESLNCDHSDLPWFSDDCGPVGLVSVFEQVKQDLLAALPPLASLNAQFSVTPSSGPAPLPVTMDASVGGSAIGTVNMTFWWNCDDDTTSVARANAVCGNVPEAPTGSCAMSSHGYKCSHVNATNAHLTHTYDTPGTYSAKLIVERGSAPADEVRKELQVAVPSCSTPATPGLVTPARGATNVSVLPMLGWFESPGADAYDIQVCSDAACIAPVRQGTSSTSAWNVSPALQPATSYYWRVRPRKSCGAAGTWTSLPFDFTTETPTNPDFEVTCEPTELIARAGSLAESTCSVNSLAGFGSTVYLTTEGLSSGVMAIAQNLALTPFPGGTVSTKFTFNVNGSQPPGVVSFQVRGDSGSLSHSVAMSLEVLSAGDPDFTINCNPTDLSGQRGDTLMPGCVIFSQNGFQGAVELSLRDVPPGVEWSVSPAPVVPPADMAIAATLTLSIGPETIPGSYAFNLYATSGVSASGQITVPMSLAVTAGPDFTIGCNDLSLSVASGGLTDTQCFIKSLYGFSTPVEFTCGSAEPGLQCGFTNPNPITPPVNGFAGNHLNVFVEGYVPAGNYAMTVLGTTDELRHSRDLMVFVTGDPTFTLACNPANTGSRPAGTASTVCSARSLGGYAGSVTLEARDLPVGFTAQLAPPILDLSPGQTASAQLHIAVPGDAAAESYDIVVAGSDGEVESLTPITLSVLASTPLWARTYSMPGVLSPRALRHSADGGFLLAATHDADAVIAKLDVDGLPVWQKLYSGSYFDEPNAIALLDDGGVVMVGRTRSPLPACTGGSAFWVVRMEADGAIRWQRAYNGGVCGSQVIARGVETTPDDGFVVVGESYEFGAGSADAWVLRLDAEGELLWQRSYGRSSPEFPYGVRAALDGGFWLVGFTGTDVWVVKLSRDGEILRERTFHSGVAYDFEITHDEGIIAVGGTTDSAWVLRLDAGGEILWQKTYRGLGGAVANDVYQTRDGNFVIAASGYCLPDCRGGELWVFKVDDEGTILWQRSYPGDDGNVSDPTRRIVEADDGSLLAVGPTSDGALRALRLSPDGEIPGCEGLQLAAGSGTNTSATGGSVVSQVTTTTGAPQATYPMTILDASLAVAEQCAAKAPMFTLSSAPGSVSTARGREAPAQITLQSIGSFSGSVDLSCPDLPPGVTCSFASSTVSLTPDGFADTTLFVAASMTTPTGTSRFRVVGTSGARIVDTMMTFTLLSPLATAIVPSSGSTGGGETATIRGENFQLGATVNFSSPPAFGIVSAVTPEVITLTTPAHATGIVDVVVTNPDGQTTVLEDAFEFACQPAPTALVHGDATVCPGETTTIYVDLTGTGPWQVTWSDGFVQSATTTPLHRNVAPTETTAFTVAVVSDSRCPGYSIGAAVVETCTVIFKDGFESGDSSAWSTRVP